MYVKGIACAHVPRSAAIMSKASLSSLLLSGGVGNGRGAGGVAEGGDWGGRGITAFLCGN